MQRVAVNNYLITNDHCPSERKGEGGGGLICV